MEVRVAGGGNPKLFTRKMEHIQAKLATKKSGIMKFMTRVKPKEVVPVRKEVRSWF